MLFYRELSKKIGGIFHSHDFNLAADPSNFTRKSESIGFGVPNHSALFV